MQAKRGKGQEQKKKDINHIRGRGSQTAKELADGALGKI